MERRNNKTSKDNQNVVDIKESNEDINDEDDNLGDNIDKDKEEHEELDQTPIEIVNMNNANHTNMESVAEGDMVQNFRQNMKFKLETDQAAKRMNKNHDNEMNDCEGSNINNTNNDDVDCDNNNEENENKFMLIKDFYLFSRFTKLFPHLFINSALDWTRPRPRMISEKEAIHKMM